MLELTKPKLGSLVIATVVSGILLTGKFIDFFYLSFALFLTTLVVASATTLNCWMEKDVDSLMERTKDRALPSGRLKPIVALIQGIVLIAISIPLLVIYVNVDTAILGFVAFALYLFAYTPMKSKSPLALYVGAIPGAIPPVMGRTIVVGHIDPFGWILFAILFVWQLPHFMAISIYHNDDYMTGGIKVYSHVLSEKVLKILIVLLTVLLLGISVLPYFYQLSSFNYLIASSVLGGLFVLQSLFGFFTKTEEQYIVWARQYFIGSIIYLPLLMAAMIFLS
ncbi:MAG: protoheme IX farnesyltransferase [Bacteriovorax sp. MedPE-SWde]|nr:MAG: protoheme IX farnesyltransferase [Bacteriovorax sp. MedPE-SWde]